MGFVALLDLFGKYGVWEIGRCDDDVILKLFLLKCNEKAKGNLFLLQKSSKTRILVSVPYLLRFCGITRIYAEKQIVSCSLHKPVDTIHWRVLLVYSLCSLFVVITRCSCGRPVPEYHVNFMPYAGLS
mgnify:CR=1 FL=1|jgi:hypothetical protein